MHIYILSAFSLLELDTKKIKVPVELVDVSSDLNIAEYFSSQNVAIENMKKNYESFLKETPESKDFEIVYYKLSEYKLNSNKYIDTAYYSPNGTFLYSTKEEGKAFHGITKPSLFNVNDWVLFVDGTNYNIGQIGATPFTADQVKRKQIENLDGYDNCYYIIDYNGSTHDHSHVKEVFILGKIDENEALNHLSREAIDLIKEKTKEYQSFYQHRFIY